MPRKSRRGGEPHITDEWFSRLNNNEEIKNKPPVKQDSGAYLSNEEIFLFSFILL